MTMFIVDELIVGR